MPATKLDLYKLHKDEYITPQTPTLVKCKSGKYLTIDGQGAPGGEVFTERLGLLYAVAFTIKMEKKFAGQDYKVCGLEGLWWGPQGGADFLTEPRETWCWKLILRVPDFITAQDLKAAIAAVKEKGKGDEAGDVRLEKINEGLCLQALHVGPYATEMHTLARMRAFARENGLCFHGQHHEIYLSDPRRAAPEKMRTILRLPIKRG